MNTLPSIRVVRRILLGLGVGLTVSLAAAQAPQPQPAAHGPSPGATGTTEKPVLISAKGLAGRLPCTMDLFEVSGCRAFLIRPKNVPAGVPMPWVWYAPVIGNPSPNPAWMLQQWVDKGIAMAGVDVGESYGSPRGRQVFTAFWELLTKHYRMSQRACLLPQSRGGLMLYNWAAENPSRVACIAGIYTVCDLRSYPGLKRACGAYGLSEAELELRLMQHNPVDRLSPLAKAQVPILHIHGDVDKLVPLERNSGELARRYRELGGPMKLIVVPGKGHQVCDEFFRCQELVDFIATHALAQLPSQKPRMYFADTVSGRPFSKDPAVVKFQGRYWLYYSLPPYEGKSTPGWSIGVATSRNLLDWEKAGELANAGEAERQGFCAPGAIVLGSKVHLFYQTYGNGPKDAICHAWSEDGLHFHRNPTNPIFRPQGTWNCGRAIDADVISYKGRLLMYWATRDPAYKVQMQGVAAAPLESDFARNQWIQLDLNHPILKPELPWEGSCIEAAAMAEHDGRLYMFYAGNYNNRPQQVGVAVSDDGVHFTRLSDTPFLPQGPAGSWNSSESGHPFMFCDDDRQHYLFYQGNNDQGRSWYLSVVPVDWQNGKPVLNEHKLPRP